MEVSLVLVAVFTVLVFIAHGIGHHRGLMDGYNTAITICDQEQEEIEDLLLSYTNEDGYLEINGETVHISEFLRE